MKLFLKFLIYPCFPGSYCSQSMSANIHRWKLSRGFLSMNVVHIGFLGSVDVSLEWTSEDGLEGGSGGGESYCWWSLGSGEDLDRDLLVFTPVYMDWAEDRHFEEIFSLFYCSKNFWKKKNIEKKELLLKLWFVLCPKKLAFCQKRAFSKTFFHHFST